jgi:hypothetical protein
MPIELKSEHKHHPTPSKVSVPKPPNETLNVEVKIQRESLPKNNATKI